MEWAAGGGGTHLKMRVSMLFLIVMKTLWLSSVDVRATPSSRIIISPFSDTQDVIEAHSTVKIGSLAFLPA